MATSSNYDVCEDTIFVQGLPKDTTAEQLAEYFGQIGIIKYDKKNECPKIWVYKDKTTGEGKGEATITYDDPPTATSAISWFNGKEFKGAALTIQLAQRKPMPQFNRGGGRGGGFDRGGRGFRNDRGGGGGAGFDRSDRAPRGDDRGRPAAGSGRPGDWMCPSCSNNNFAYRQECNRCRTQKPGGGGGGGGGRDNNREGRDNNRDRGRDHRDSNSNRDRDNYRDRDRGDRNRSGYSGPSRSHHMGDRRSRPY